MNGEAGKGDGSRRRQCSYKQYSDNFDRAFPSKTKIVCPICGCNSGLIEGVVAGYCQHCGSQIFKESQPTF